jgi:hypothetical protein
MLRFLFGICLALWSAATSFAQTPVTIDLGYSKDLATLYSFPNCGEVCQVDRTLPQTIEHYLDHSLKRDGFVATTVTVSESSGRISVVLNGAGAADYAKVLPQYLKAGTDGLKGARELLDARGDDGRRLWRYYWRFFLPHGVAMVRHRTVQLLHFPPDSVLMDTQDYLAAQTTRRWAELLQKNGAAKDDIGRFQNIIDLAPIAAPHKDGSLLDGVYRHFDIYIKGLLDLWLPLPAQAGSRPLVVFGSPARGWVKAVYNVDLSKPLDLRTVILASGMKVPALAANHPSRIWFANNEPENKQLAVAMEIMEQDLVAACWQVKMGMDATAAPEPTLATCKQNWSGKDKELCELSYTQVFHKTEDVAKCLCTHIGPDLRRSLSDKYLDTLPE